MPYGPNLTQRAALGRTSLRAAAGLKPAERGPGGGLTATYCTQLCERVRAKMQHLPHEMLIFIIGMGLLDLLGASCKPLGGFLGVSWGRLGGLLGASWVSWRALGAFLGVRVVLGPSWGRLGAILARLEAVLGPSWRVLEPSWRRLGAILGPSWRLLGPSWGFLGPSWGHL